MHNKSYSKLIIPTFRHRLTILSTVLSVSRRAESSFELSKNRFSKFEKVKSRTSHMATLELYGCTQLKDVFRTVDLVGVEHLSISFGAILEGEADF